MAATQGQTAFTVLKGTTSAHSETAEGSTFKGGLWVAADTFYSLKEKTEQFQFSAHVLQAFREEEKSEWL